MRGDDEAWFERELRADRNSSRSDAYARVDRPNRNKVRIVWVVGRAVVRWKVHDGDRYAAVLCRRFVRMVYDLSKCSVRTIGKAELHCDVGSEDHLRSESQTQNWFADVV